MMENKVHSDIKIVSFSAPSGSGKSTIINRILSGLPGVFEFSISATSRQPRGTEKNGVEYYFLSPDEFRSRIAKDEFIEHEEVYKDRFYGTLKSEITRICDKGKVVLLDIDVKGAINVKKMYSSQCLSLFIQPPSIDVLRKRLQGRQTDSPEEIQRRLNKASFELNFAPQFDQIIINDDLDPAVAEALASIKVFLNK